MSRPTIFTGGTGLLGHAMKKIAPDFVYPTRGQFDVRDIAQMRSFAERVGAAQIFHAAAATSPPVVDKDPVKALEANIIGTGNVVKVCVELGLRLIYVSTDYVFSGDKGYYTENDPVHPVNKYAWSKLGGECAVRLYDNSLIVRTTFGPDRFPYDKAFKDQYTSRESVTVIAGKLLALAKSGATGVVHVGGSRRTVLEYARSLDAARIIGELSIHEVSFKVPVDTSLDCSRYRELLSSSDK